MDAIAGSLPPEQDKKVMERVARIVLVAPGEEIRARGDAHT
jgi:hypothetical protein